jgi:hypothetical protein
MQLDNESRPLFRRDGNGLIGFGNISNGGLRARREVPYGEVDH